MHHLINQYSPVLLDIDRPVDHRGADYNDEGKINTTQTFWGASFQLATFVFITSVKNCGHPVKTQTFYGYRNFPNSPVPSN